MNHFIRIIKDIGLHMNGFVSFISDTKSIVTGTYTILFMIAFIIDITINGGTNTTTLLSMYLIGISKL